MPKARVSIYDPRLGNDLCVTLTERNPAFSSAKLGLLVVTGELVDWKTHEDPLEQVLSRKSGAAATAFVPSAPGIRRAGAAMGLGSKVDAALCIDDGTLSVLLLSVGNDPLVRDTDLSALLKSLADS